MRADGRKRKLNIYKLDIVIDCNMHESKDIIIEAKDIPTMLQELERGFYAIPVFQREFVWDLSNIKSLWDSIYRHYPIGSFLIWETEEKYLRTERFLI